MNTGIHAREKSDRRAGVFLNEERFEMVTKALGADSDSARARLLRMDPKTIYLARRGVIGEKFIASALTVMREHEAELKAVGILPTFEAMFEVGLKRVAA
jgi:hypothetical protein